MSRENCNEYLKKHNKPYPRTCAECGLGGCKYKPELKAIEDLTKKQYEDLKRIGYLSVLYPHSTGDYFQDTGKQVNREDYLRELLAEAVQIIDKIKYWPDHDIMIDKFKEKVKSFNDKSVEDN